MIRDPKGPGEAADISRPNGQGRPIQSPDDDVWSDSAERPVSVQHNVARLRMDGWNRLRDHGRCLARTDRVGGDAPKWKEEVERDLEILRPYEPYWAFPGPRGFEKLSAFFKQGAYDAFAKQSARVVELLAKDSYRNIDLSATRLCEYADLVNVSKMVEAVDQGTQTESRPYFEVLLVDDLTPDEASNLRREIRALRTPEDEFIYELVVVRSFEDAVAAVLLNGDIQSVVIRYVFPFRSRGGGVALTPEAKHLLEEDLDAVASLVGSERSRRLGPILKELRPDLDAFLVTDSPPEQVAGAETEAFDRLFHRENYHRELHLSILKGVGDRAETPFLTALQRYSRKPTGVFHALPIGQGTSILKSHWIQDKATFFGPSSFTGETSATTGGLDSLLQPHGPLKTAQGMAARAFGAKKTYFVTNGTSTANKIVMQGLIRPGDIVLLAHDCHKSHPYAVIMSGALPVYLNTYPLSEFSMYGGVPLREIKRRLLELRASGKLDRVKMLLLTNITFDGITYDPERIMAEVLAIKPDMIFVWDEAWFAYGRFHPTLRRRTAMEAARRLKARLRSDAYRQEFGRWKAEFQSEPSADDPRWLDERLLPDPAEARVRVYATQSTHKTLTALRQGSMIHIRDEAFDQDVSDAFEEAYMTHTSTSPSYPILASLDMGRRQVELEGYALVQESVEIAMTLRQRIHTDPLLRRYFRIMGPQDMIPEGYRPSGLTYYFASEKGWANLTPSWRSDEFTLDPTRITLHVGATGMDGSEFKQLLMDRFAIQVNKTSRNTILLLTHIGTTPATGAHLVKALTRIATDLDERLADQSAVARRIHRERVASLTENLPPLPHFSRFHQTFLTEPDSRTPEGDMRRAFFMAYNSAVCDHVRLDAALVARVAAGEEIVSASFVTPYPPGFPVLVPGQVMSREILDYLRALDVKEIHGYRPEFGLRIFRPEALRVTGAGEGASQAVKAGAGTDTDAVEAGEGRDARKVQADQGDAPGVRRLEGSPPGKAKTPAPSAPPTRPKRLPTGKEGASIEELTQGKGN